MSTQNWFSITQNPTSIKNNIENKNRSKKIIKNVFGNSDYVLKNIEDFNQIIDVARTYYQSSTICRILNWINKNQVAQTFDLSIPLKKLKQNVTSNNFICNDDFEKLFGVLIDGLKNKTFLSSPNQLGFVYLYILCSFFGLSISDARKISIAQINTLITDNTIIINRQKTKTYQKLFIKNDYMKNILLLLYNSIISSNIVFKNEHLLFKKHYENTLNRIKPKNLGFHSLRFRFSIIPNNIDMNLKMNEMGHSSTLMTNHYINTQLKNEYFEAMQTS